MEKEESKSFRNDLDKSDRKKFDEMWDIPRLYASTCSNSCQLVSLHPIILSILFHHHYKELKECISEVERIEAKVNSSKKKEWSTKKEEEEEKQQEKKKVPTTLDGWFIKNKIAES
jgi:hypothetical protein